MFNRILNTVELDLEHYIVRCSELSYSLLCGARVMGVFGGAVFPGMFQSKKGTKVLDQHHADFNSLGGAKGPFSRISDVKKMRRQWDQLVLFFV